MNIVRVIQMFALALVISIAGCRKGSDTQLPIFTAACSIDPREATKFADAIRKVLTTHGFVVKGEQPVPNRGVWMIHGIGGDLEVVATNAIDISTFDITLHPSAPLADGDGTPTVKVHAIELGRKVLAELQTMAPCSEGAKSAINPARMLESNTNPQSAD